MYGELPGLDDLLAIQDAYSRTWSPRERAEYIKETERKLDDLLGFAQKHTLAGYDMREWRRRLFVPFDAEYNRLVTNYAEAIEAAQGGRKIERRVGRRLENAYYRELLDRPRGSGKGA